MSILPHNMLGNYKKLCWLLVALVSLVCGYYLYSIGDWEVLSNVIIDFGMGAALAVVVVIFRFYPIVGELVFGLFILGLLALLGVASLQEYNPAMVLIFLLGCSIALFYYWRNGPKILASFKLTIEKFKS